MKADAPAVSEQSEEIADGAPEVEKPKRKKRAPTAKQLEEAEAAARPRYDPSKDRPAPYTAGPTTSILTWNVTSLNATLKKDPEAISKLVDANNADIVCLQVSVEQLKSHLISLGTYKLKA